MAPNPLATWAVKNGLDHEDYGRLAWALFAELTAQTGLAHLLKEIGESVEIYYEPRNEGDEWYVGLADPHGHELPLHGHFGTLQEGLEWLVKNLGDR